MPHAALYLRISSDPDGERVGVERQLADCTAIASTRFPELPTRVYEDNDVSAWSGVRRPLYAAMLDQIRSRQIAAVVAWNLDRLFRHPRDLETFLDLCASVALTRVTTAQGDIDLSSHDGQLHARILGAVAKKESDDKSRRLKRSASDRAERGLWNGGPIPFGYTSGGPGKLVIVPEEADQIVTAARHVAEGGSLSGALDAMGDVMRVPTRISSLRKLLLSSTVRGLTRAGVRGWQPILDDVTAARVRHVLTAEGRGPTSHARTSWLTGVLVCGRCGETARVKRFTDKPRYYVCKQSCTGIRADYTDMTVEEFIFVRVAAFNPVARTDIDIALTVEQMEGYETRLADARTMWMDGEIDRDEWAHIKKLANERIAELREQIANATVDPDDALIDARTRWATMTVHQRHALARRVLDRVVIMPVGGARRFDPSRLVPTYRL